MPTSGKAYVCVLAKFDESGGVVPLKIRWEDGRVFLIDRVLDQRRAASLKAGGSGQRFTVQVEGKTTYLWRDDDRWFVERK